MPPKASDTMEVDPDTQIPLQQWLKLLNTRGVEMRVAMGLAGKIYSTHGTRTKLAMLNNSSLKSLVTDKDQRRSVVVAVKGLLSGETPSKRKRGPDFVLPGAPDAHALSLEFKLVTDPEELLPLVITTNRAPVLTAWVYTVAGRLGFDKQESLSLASVFVNITSTQHALSLGNILSAEDKKDAELEMQMLPRDGGDGKWVGGRPGGGRAAAVDFIGVGSSQPWVGIMGKRIPVIEMTGEVWRGISKGIAVEPSQAYTYITRAFHTSTGHVLGAMKLLADSYEPEELNQRGYGIYANFKPDVGGWGQKGLLHCATILEQIKDRPAVEIKLEAAERNVKEEKLPAKFERLPSEDTTKVEAASADEDDSEERPMKRVKRGVTLEEYEAMLDAEDAGGYIP